MSYIECRIKDVIYRMSYCIVLRGRYFNNIIFNVHVTSEENSDDSKDSFVRNRCRFSIIFLSII